MNTIHQDMGEWLGLGLRPERHDLVLGTALRCHALKDGLAIVQNLTHAHDDVQVLCKCCQSNFALQICADGLAIDRSLPHRCNTSRYSRSAVFWDFGLKDTMQSLALRLQALKDGLPMNENLPHERYLSRYGRNAAFRVLVLGLILHIASTAA